MSNTKEIKKDKNNAMDFLVEECLPLAVLLEESSSFPAKLEEMFLLQKKLMITVKLLLKQSISESSQHFQLSL